jgi:hypothetical protein
MLKYSCSNAKLVNWLLYQLNDQPGMIFPRKKGWKLNLKLLYPGDGKIPCYLILISNESELLIFIPLDNKVEKSQVKSLTSKKFVHEMKVELKNGIRNSQTIFLTSEKNEEKVSPLLTSFSDKINLLKLDYERMSFSLGNFTNPRLEFRLSSQQLDTDLIPNLLPEMPREVTAGMSISLFYQNLFSVLNRNWFSGVRQIHIRNALKESIPYWNQFRKKDQQEIIKRTTSDLKIVIKDFAFDGFKLVSDGKSPDSQSVSLVKFPSLPESKKELNNWQRKQQQALNFLRDEGKQISIDIIDLESFTEFQTEIKEN